MGEQALQCVLAAGTTCMALDYERKAIDLRAKLEQAEKELNIAARHAVLQADAIKQSRGQMAPAALAWCENQRGYCSAIADLRAKLEQAEKWGAGQAGRAGMAEARAQRLEQANTAALQLIDSMFRDARTSAATFSLIDLQEIAAALAPMNPL